MWWTIYVFYVYSEDPLPACVESRSKLTVTFFIMIYGLICSYPGWLLASLAFVSGCTFGSVGIQQASVLSFHPLFNSAISVFLAQLPVISLDSTFSAWTYFP